jgi:hypothetical protein
MEKLPVGIYTFCDFIKENYLYIDKTKDIYWMKTLNSMEYN